MNQRPHIEMRSACLPRHPALVYLYLVKRIRHRMKSDEQRDFVLLGSYPPREAAKLLKRFHQAGIAFRTQPRTPPPEPRLTVVIDVSVDSTRASEVAQIQRELFGG